MFPFTGPARRVKVAARKFAAVLPDAFSLDGRQRVTVQDRQVALLRNGQRPLNLDFALPDGFSQSTGLVATVFARDGDDFIRVTTSVRKQDGERAIGTPLDRSQPAYDDVLQGRAHLGYATIFGKQYLTHYEPVKDASGRIIGILFVGLDITDSPGMGLSAAMAWRISVVYGLVQTVLLGVTGQLRNPSDWVIGGVMMALLWACTYLLMNHFVALPLRAGRAASQRVASGDLTRQVHVSSSDDAGQILLAINSINIGLTLLMGKVRSSTTIVAMGTSEIADGNMDLANRTEKQAGEVNAAASAVHELTSTVAHTADQAAQLNSLVASVSGVASNGGDVVQQVVRTMGQISASANKINDIIGLIEGIAFQTNILALNAAVEAARAGEQGRGFAVVASEVRSLAQRSSGAAREIKDLIGASVNSVAAGSDLVDKTRQAMEHITGAISEVVSYIDGIAQASQEQRAGIESVNRSVSAIDQMTQQNVALVEKAAAAALKMRDQAHTLGAAVDSFKTHR
ncbi:methyl-accepting chemotaxis protein [Rhodoferax saidenbachensis]|uniref:Methyl-accepting chemotaxis protein-2 (Aspartate sensor receptor) n=1 Tax=Rhodoferax saidenbachensis TaxID=1484693 RepID=A0ABU1ZTD2_9BURK|nr:methyl-accepting chemotaxis protein [Rhodoferax saidenbachensis]MDR7308738.1 methyl-accepting chemotaxis protein-2 (aspartate sensor receptor) [Rhodoferax saidenbachensis]